MEEERRRRGLGASARRRARRVGLAAGILALLAYAASPLAVARVFTAPHHVAVALPEGATGYEAIAFPSRVDRLILRGWLIRPAAPVGRTAVLVHGHDATRLDVLPLGNALAARGWTVLVFDLRGSGESDGDRYTGGNLEQRDVLGAYDALRARGFAPSCTLMLGESGGGVALLTAAPSMPDVAAVVTDSAWANLRAVITSRTHGVPWPLLWWPLTAGGWVGGFDVDLDPVAAVRAQPRRAFLFLHGAADGYVPPENAADLRAASANPGSRLVLIPGATHTKGFATDPGRYLAAVLGFADARMGRGCGT